MDFNDLIQPEDLTDQFDPQEVEQNKIYGILGYLIPVLFFLPAVSLKNSPAAKFISNQQFILFVLWAATVPLSFIPIIKIIAGLIRLVLLILSIWGIVDSANNRVRKLPLIKAIPPIEIFK